MENELKISLALVIVSFLVGWYAFSLMPDQVASHWDVSGQVNGYLPKIFGAFLIPVILAAIFVFFLIIPKIDPLRANIELFKVHYYRFLLVVLAFMFVVYVQTILWNLGVQISFNLTLPILLGGMFFYLGGLLEKSKRNWFIGIRTPWTLSSDVVWEKTHKFGAKIFELVAVLMLFCIALPDHTFFIILGLILVATLGTIVYSYFAYADLAKIIKKKR